MNEVLKAPFPYFGGKSRIASEVWKRFGVVTNYVEPFFGSGATLCARPQPFTGVETVNDKDGMVANFWRALQADPDAVAFHADWPVNENDQHARHSWLVARKDSLQAKLEGDPDFYDAKVAGWWCWGMCCWIGSGWCSGDGPWQSVDGELVKVDGNAGQGVHRKRVHLGGAGRGVHRKLVHLGDAGRGVHRQLVHLGNAGRGVHRRLEESGLYEWMNALAERLRHVRVCCGDWTRVTGPTVTERNGTAAIFLDPPYSAEAGRDNNLYAHESLDVAHDCREWAIERGADRELRIALCGYEGEHAMPEDWECLAWKTAGGYGNQTGDPNENANRERIWFSPGCLRGEFEPMLFS